MITSVRSIWSRAGFLGAKNLRVVVLEIGLKTLQFLHSQITEINEFSELSCITVFK